nr:hypothetical protein [uncultured Arsenicibacter sp.]
MTIINTPQVASDMEELKLLATQLVTEFMVEVKTNNLQSDRAQQMAMMVKEIKELVQTIQISLRP